MDTTESHVYEQIGVAMTCRSYGEYVAMFQFEDDVLRRHRVLDVAAGASSFVAECLDKGIDGTAVDPLYTLSFTAISDRGQQEIDESTQKLANLSACYCWDYYGNLSQHKALRQASLRTFEASYKVHRDCYITGSLPNLPFPDDSFSMVLCNHFLFLYHLQFDLAFHKEAIHELIRVCQPGGEVRIYPVATLAREPYPHQPELLDFINHLGCRTALTETTFQFLPSASHVLQIQKP